ncbi:Cof-type HAD-IIB family hydrolase [Atopobacter phocae]|uniref:Cof-type HAD-IIB family hydrolase n=1 Tax=Atopobacter phocae TaxID=136492 RepID=UPI00047243A6|nr:Cof-type HAD-IIB family hydrolase [Atopobacter phocae]
MIKLIAIDMDGTLLNSDKTLSQAHINSLNQAIAKQLKIVICTGRPLKGITPFLNQIHLTDQDFIISNNGASIITSSEHQLIYEEALTAEHIRDIVALLPDIDSGVVVTNDEAYYSISPNESSVMAWDANLVNMPLIQTNLLDLSTNESYYKILIGHDKKVLDNFYTQIPQTVFDQYYVVRSQDHLIEIQKKHVHKGTAFKWLCQHLEIRLEEAAAIGDGNNDIEMLETAGIGIAMGNASDAVKAISDYEVTTNDQAGVSEAIEYLIQYNTQEQISEQGE